MNSWSLDRPWESKPASLFILAQSFTKLLAKETSNWNSLLSVI